MYTTWDSSIPSNAFVLSCAFCSEVNIWKPCTVPQTNEAELSEEWWKCFETRCLGRVGVVWKDTYNRSPIGHAVRSWRSMNISYSVQERSERWENRRHGLVTCSSIVSQNTSIVVYYLTYTSEPARERLWQRIQNPHTGGLVFACLASDTVAT